MKDFSSLNQMCETALQTVSTDQIARYASTYKATLSKLQGVPSQYSDAYAQVQLLKYTESGDIEDVTTADRKSIAESVLTNAVRLGDTAIEEMDTYEEYMSTLSVLRDGAESISVTNAANISISVQGGTIRGETVIMPTLFTTDISNIVQWSKQRFQWRDITDNVVKLASCSNSGNPTTTWNVHQLIEILVEGNPKYRYFIADIRTGNYQYWKAITINTDYDDNQANGFIKDGGACLLSLQQSLPDFNQPVPIFDAYDAADVQQIRTYTIPEYKQELSNIVDSLRSLID